MGGECCSQEEEREEEDGNEDSSGEEGTPGSTGVAADMQLDYLQLPSEGRTGRPTSARIWSSSEERLAWASDVQQVLHIHIHLRFSVSPSSSSLCLRTH